MINLHVIMYSLDSSNSTGAHFLPICASDNTFENADKERTGIMPPSLHSVSIPPSIRDGDSYPGNNMMAEFG
jgi:hypothetical protein